LEKTFCPVVDDVGQFVSQYSDLSVERGFSKERSDRVFPTRDVVDDDVVATALTREERREGSGPADQGGVERCVFAELEIDLHVGQFGVMGKRDQDGKLVFFRDRLVPPINGSQFFDVSRGVIIPLELTGSHFRRILKVGRVNTRRIHPGCDLRRGGLNLYLLPPVFQRSFFFRFSNHLRFSGDGLQDVKLAHRIGAVLGLREYEFFTPIHLFVAL